MLSKMKPIGIERAKELFREADESFLRGKLDTVDQQALIDEADRAYRSEIWDRKRPINGCSATTLLATRKDIPADGEVFLIIDVPANCVVVFQPFVPSVGGRRKMTTEDVHVHATNSRQKCANDRALLSIRRHLQAALRAA